MERRAGIAETLLTSAEGPKILGCLWNNICTKLHDDPTRGLVADGDVKVALWIGPANEQKEGGREGNYAIKHLLALGTNN